MAQRWLNGEKTGGTLLAALLLVGCGASEASRDAVGTDDSDSSGDLAVPTDEEGSLAGGIGETPAEPRAPASPPVSAPPQQGTGAVAPGTLTAGAWDDSRNFDRFLEYRRQVESSSLPGLPWFDEQAQRAAAAQAARLAEHATLDVALVIDTTSSMKDELTYLQSEFDALSSAIEAAYPGAEQRWALIVYRDDGDEYLTRSFDFEDAASFRQQLAQQHADGGGDYPEAADAALEAMNQLAWRTDDDTARLAFWVGDAPHHVEQTEALAAAVGVAGAQDVHVYPVASSGVDELTEYSMRATAQLTRGRYLFLTDDSGVGGAHEEPTIPCYFVTRLDDAILRMVDIEMTGAYRVPAAEDIVRAGGDPTDGACLLASGQTVLVF